MSALIQGDTLKPCPFCGSEAETYYNGEDNVWQTACLNDDCGAIQFGMTNVCSERNWNVRTGSEWIRVNDRMPDRGVDVIALTDTGCVVKISYTTTDGDYWVGMGGFLVVPDITHWMPLPASPTP